MKVVIGSVVAALIGAAKADCPEAEITFFGDETCESVLDVPDDAVQAILDGAVDAMQAGLASGECTEIPDVGKNFQASCSETGVSILEYEENTCETETDSFEINWGGCRKLNDFYFKVDKKASDPPVVTTIDCPAVDLSVFSDDACEEEFPPETSAALGAITDVIEDGIASGECSTVPGLEKNFKAVCTENGTIVTVYGESDCQTKVENWELEWGGCRKLTEGVYMKPTIAETDSNPSPPSPSNNTTVEELVVSDDPNCPVALNVSIYSDRNCTNQTWPTIDVGGEDVDVATMLDEQFTASLSSMDECVSFVEGKFLKTSCTTTGYQATIYSDEQCQNLVDSMTHEWEQCIIVSYELESYMKITATYGNNTSITSAKSLLAGVAATLALIASQF